ncbi:MAG: hypothetical protein MHM6MM_008048 [Cercozoa sp. M6MM]
MRAKHVDSDAVQHWQLRVDARLRLGDDAFSRIERKWQELNTTNPDKSRGFVRFVHFEKVLGAKLSAAGLKAAERDRTLRDTWAEMDVSGRDALYFDDYVAYHSAQIPDAPSISLNSSLESVGPISTDDEVRELRDALAQLQRERDQLQHLLRRSHTQTAELRQRLTELHHLKQQHSQSQQELQISAARAQAAQSECDHAVQHCESLERLLNARNDEVRTLRQRCEQKESKIAQVREENERLSKQAETNESELKATRAHCARLEERLHEQEEENVEVRRHNAELRVAREEALGQVQALSTECETLRKSKQVHVRTIDNLHETVDRLRKSSGAQMRELREYAQSKRQLQSRTSELEHERDELRSQVRQLQQDKDLLSQSTTFHDSDLTEETLTLAGDLVLTCDSDGLHIRADSAADSAAGQDQWSRDCALASAFLQTVKAV